MRLVPVESDAVAAVGYDRVSRTLRIRFRNGGLYDYLDVPEGVYDGLLTTPHPWTRWGDHITSRYDFRRLD